MDSVVNSGVRGDVRRIVAVDDCGNIIIPMIVQGQIYGGPTQGLGPALHEEVPYDEDGNNMAGSSMDYLVPTAVETPPWETGHTVTPSPHHPLGAKGVGESATVGALSMAGDRECGGGCVGAPGGDAYGYSDYDGSGLGGVEGEGGGRVRAWGRGRSARRVASVRWWRRRGEWGGRVSVAMVVGAWRVKGVGG